MEVSEICQVYFNAGWNESSRLDWFPLSWSEFHFELTTVFDCVCLLLLYWLYETEI